MDWKRRIGLCRELLMDFAKMLPDGSDECRDELLGTAKTIEDYTSSKAFTENKDDEKEIDSWNILMNTLGKCNEHVDEISEKLFPRPPKYVTSEEALEELMQDYAIALKEGDSTIASMNINEWMEANRFVIVDKDDERYVSSSCEGDDDVNSRTKF